MNNLLSKPVVWHREGRELGVLVPNDITITSYFKICVEKGWSLHVTSAALNMDWHRDKRLVLIKDPTKPDIICHNCMAIYMTASNGVEFQWWFYITAISPDQFETLLEGIGLLPLVNLDLWSDVAFEDLKTN